jgi:hypothetical protein
MDLRARARWRNESSSPGREWRSTRRPAEKEARPGGAALLCVCVREQRALLRDAVDVGRAVAHDAVVVGADIVNADVVIPDDQDVGLP